MQIPKFKPADSRLFRRKPFLDGTYKTFFAPGQLRDDRWCAVILTHGGLEFDGYAENTNVNPTDSWFYVPPTDWRPADSLLVPPQVVHLNVNVYGAFNEIDDGVANLKGFHPPDPDWFASIANYQRATDEHKRLATVASAVKVAIEKIRRGRTWVAVND